jgi:hypothetical protein
VAFNNFRGGFRDQDVIAWRCLDYEVESNDPIEDMNFSGPAIGAAFRW